MFFADIWSPQTVRNLRKNPVIEINVVDPFVRKGYRFKGRATLHSEGEVYERALALLGERCANARRERVKTIVLVKVEPAAALISPAHDGGVSETAVASRWERHFGELARRRRADSALVTRREGT